MCHSILINEYDPDTCGCKELYDDFIEAFFSDEHCNIEHGIKRLKM